MAIVLFSRIWGAVLGIILVPIYVQIIGIESYGLVAFYSTLAGALAILDLGLSTSITRQVAIFKTLIGKQKNLIDLVYSIEVINWIIAVIIGIIIVLLSGEIGAHWVKSNGLSINSISKSVSLMGILFAVQFPLSVYDGVMIGLQEQLKNSILNICFTSIKSIGVIVFLKYVSPTIESYFIWQIIITLLLTFTMRGVVWSKIKIPESNSRFSILELKNIWRFTTGMISVSVVTFFLSQVDKILISKMVTLDRVGYYSMACALAGGISLIISTMQPIIFPIFTALGVTNKQTELTNLYHKACRWTSILVFPIGFTLIFFSTQILRFWTNNELIVENTSIVLQIFAAGTMLNSLMSISYLFTIAKGDTKLIIILNSVASIIIIPLLIIAITYFNIIGAAVIWLTLNIGYFVFWLPIFHDKYFKNQYAQFIGKDLLIPFLTSIILFVLFKFAQFYWFPYINVGQFILMLITIFILYAFQISELRYFIFKTYNNYLNKK